MDRFTKANLAHELQRYPSVFKPVHWALRLGRRGCSVALRERRIKKYMQENQVRRLQIGAGSKLLPGWLNTDLQPTRMSVVVLDVTKEFPFDAASIDYVLAEHVIEHVPYSQGTGMLQECFRTLRPGGKVRVSTPDLDSLARIHADPKTDEHDAFIRKKVDAWLADTGIYTSCFVVNLYFRAWGHQFIYDSRTLMESMEAVGFRDVVVQEYGLSDDPMLCDVDTRSEGVVNLIVQGTRP